MGEASPNSPRTESNGHPGGGGDSIVDLRQRVAELEAALAKMTRQRDETRRMLFELYEAAFPGDRPPTEEELLEERKTLSARTISEFLAELERGA